MRSTVLLLVASALLGCSVEEPLQNSDNVGRAELSQKPEWSLLQVLEYESRERPHNEQPLIIVEAKGTDVDVVGLPRADRDRGYVWLIAQSSTVPLVKVMPEQTDFRLTRQQLLDIKQRLQLSEKVSLFLDQRASTN